MPKTVRNGLLLELTSSLRFLKDPLDLAAPQVSNGFEPGALSDREDTVADPPPAYLQSLHQPVRDPCEQWLTGFVHP